jgi:hypothetical protein
VCCAVLCVKIWISEWCVFYCSSLLSVANSKHMTSSRIFPFILTSLLPSVSSSTSDSIGLPSLLSIDYSCLHQSSWLFNSVHEINSIFMKESDILTSTLSTSTERGWNISHLNGVVKYNSQETISQRRERREGGKGRGEGEGKTMLQELGEEADVRMVSHGEDIGLIGCHGYWPVDICPHITEESTYYSLEPAPDTHPSGGCFQNSHGAIGQFVNGAHIFSFFSPHAIDHHLDESQSQRQGHEQDSKDQTLKSLSESERDEEELWTPVHTPRVVSSWTDICEGYVDQHGYYGHLFYSPCLTERLSNSDSFSDHSPVADHSPIYGWSLDNYPICGPYQVLSQRLLAQSSWRLRDYTLECDDVFEKGEEQERGQSERMCVLNDPLQPDKGVRALRPSSASASSSLAFSGPSFKDQPLGSFFEDYFYDPSPHLSSSSLSLSLDDHNGHSHEPYGYHYHLTIDEETHQPVFPFVIGPQFYGCLSESSEDRRGRGTCCRSIHQSRTNTCTPLSLSSSSSTCGQTAASERNQCSGLSSDESGGSSSLTPPDLFLSSYISSSVSSSSPHRHLDTPIDTLPPTLTPTLRPSLTFSQFPTMLNTLTPTLVPTVFQSPTFKPSLTFVSQLPTTVTLYPSISPSLTHHGQGHNTHNTRLTSKDIALIVLISVGVLVVVVSGGVLIYWQVYTRAGPVPGGGGGYADVSSRSYVEKIKDLTGISLVET